MKSKTAAADVFEANRSHLRAVACRILGSLNEAEDAVQETWLRLSRTNVLEIENLGGWLTITVGRICLDMLKSRAKRREDPLGAPGVEIDAIKAPERNPEEQIAAADSIGLALFVVLEKLEPAERLAFVLHDVFAVPFADIAPIVGRSMDATRQLASRARRRVQGASTNADAGRARHRELVEAFLTAAQGGDFKALLAVLDPDVVFRADSEAVRLGSPHEIIGAPAVAKAFEGRAGAALPTLVDGGFGFVVAPQEGRHFVLRLGFRGDRIAEVLVIADPESLARLELTILPD